MAKPTEKPAPAKPAKPAKPGKPAAASRRPPASRNGHVVPDSAKPGQSAPTCTPSEPAPHAPTSRPAEADHGPRAPAAGALATEAASAETIEAGATPSVREPAAGAAALKHLARDPGTVADRPAFAPLAWLEGCGRLRDELVGFARAQLEDALATGQAMLGCGSLPEALQLQTGYALRTMQSNVTQAARLARLSAELMQAASTPRRPL